LLVAAADTAEAVRAALPKGASLRIHHAADAHALDRALEKPDWSLVLSCLELPGYSALDLARRLGAKGSHVPIVLILGTGPDEMVVRCLEAGLSQFIQCNDGHLKHLPALIGTFINQGQEERDRRRIEKKLRESEERYLDIFDNTSDLVQCLAPDGAFLYTNRAWREALGYSEDEARSLHLADVLHPESAACCQDRFQRLLDGESLSCIEFKFVTKHGEAVHLAGDCGSIVRDGETISTRGIFRNITDTVRAESALRASEARYQALYENAPDIYTTISPAGEILSINRTGARMLGYEVSELVGESAAKVIHPEDQAAVFAYIEARFREPCQDEGVEYRKLRKDGSVLWVHQRVSLEAEGGEPRMLVVCRDVTEKRQLREQLVHQASHDTLTNLINRREFERRLLRLLDGLSDDRERHALCFLDLDQFKAINDSCGHLAGDELLRQIAALLDGQMRSRDTLARLGGDEFAILMEHCPLENAVLLADKVRETIQRFVFHWRAQRFSLGVSIGVVPIRADQTIGDILGRADAACYAAKRAGRNRIHTADVA
jgi:diguanylate cyclase (GGDEF)-like protein/PAS domain S-box-containing protein